MALWNQQPKPPCLPPGQGEPAFLSQVLSVEAKQPAGTGKSVTTLTNC